MPKGKRIVGDWRDHFVTVLIVVLASIALVVGLNWVIQNDPVAKARDRELQKIEDQGRAYSEEYAADHGGATQHVQPVGGQPAKEMKR